MKKELRLEIRVLAFIMIALGLTMLVYWSMFVIQGMPLADIPILSELVNAALALISGIGLLRIKRWSIPTTLFTAGMWAYGVLGGINLVLEHGLDFNSPFGALMDAVLFPVVMIFSIYLVVSVWRNRSAFQ